ncbi:hypothetical protein BGZ63DRAFT_370065 [Mariannaea sp. PMI_226]|nr:hypothetical protein BGZ63DRAFT_370065 [Mariannaea sp. PMI_226]
MADPLLTSLCSICHVCPPKYKCPRCTIRTCSLACIKKHKAWSECTGERDATAYVPPAKLKTPAGIDHDYNFLHGIELAVERNEKLLIGERKLVQEEELRPLTVQEVKWKPGRDGRNRKVLVTRVLREPKSRTFERFLAQRLKKLNINITCAPMGMARQKENRTTLNRRTGRINWQVEWITFAPSNEDEEKQDDNDEDDESQEGPRKKRNLSKVMDDVPLYEAYYTMLEEQERAKTQQPKKAIRGWNGGHSQEVSDGTWTVGLHTLQSPYNGTWGACYGADAGLWPSEREEEQKRSFKYFLASSHIQSNLPSTVTELQPAECFRDILTNTRVLEFPTIYVLRENEKLPSGFVLGPKDTVPPQGNNNTNTNTNKRKNPPGKKALGKSAKKRKRGGKDVEEGEVNSDDEGRHSDDEAYSGPKVGALEAGDVLEEHSLGEDDDFEEDEDDETSSSGSDSE